MPRSSLFERIISGEIPCHLVYEDESVIAFLDTRPLSRGHTLLIPKEHARTLGELSDKSAAAIGRALPRVCRALVQVTGIQDYNILQNNGLKAHQAIDHVHFHIIPKPNFTEGLSIAWPATSLEQEEGAELSKSIRQQLSRFAA